MMLFVEGEGHLAQERGAEGAVGVSWLPRGAPACLDTWSHQS